jgi:hypothetical protein
MVMPKFRTVFNEVQYWSYEYITEADTEEEAYKLAEQKYFDGEQSDDNWLDNGQTIDHIIEEY